MRTAPLYGIVAFIIGHAPLSAQSLANKGIAIWYDARGDIESIMAPDVPWRVGS